jgi:methionyl-tRNA synthetase
VRAQRLPFAGSCGFEFPIRPITRDLDWGIPVPLEDWDGKCIYVWFEAVIGYLSAAIEWSKISGDEVAYFNWWHNPEARACYFIGKDNIPFHAVIWPAQLIGSGKTFAELMGSSRPAPLVLPYDVPANEFMNLEGQKISGSRNWAVFARDFLSRYDPDPLRYYLTVNMPEAKDTDWDWSEFQKRNNDELVATWGNLANRVLSFAFKHWEGQLPNPGELTAIDKELLATIDNGFESVAAEFEAVHLRAALAEAMRLAAEVNRYLDRTAPWKAIKTDKAAAGRAIYIALRAIDSLKIMLAPFLPFTCERLHTYLGYDQPLFGEQSVTTVEDELGKHTALRYHPEKASGRWQPSQLAAGATLRQPQPLFRKLDASIVEQERARLGKPLR